MTIVAPITPHGYGGVSIVKASGPLVINLIKKHFTLIPKDRIVYFTKFLGVNREFIDLGVLIYFKAPNSSTGEDVIEFQCHGSPVIVSEIINNLITTEGVRLARNGEFSERAFLNGKLDLAQAESIYNIIHSRNAIEAKSAVNSLEGKFSKKVTIIYKKLLKIYSTLEAHLNFIEENIEQNVLEKFSVKLTVIITLLENLQTEALHSLKYTKDLTIAIIGAPNVGKSTLFNSILNFQRSITSSIVGTTRDIIHENVFINGINLKIMDTAGIHNTNNEIEKIGVDLSYKAINETHELILTVDAKNPNIEITLELINILKTYKKNYHLVFNKIDLNEDIINKSYPMILKSDYEASRTMCSAINSYGLSELKENITSNYIRTTDHLDKSEIFLANNRHIEKIKNSIIHLKTAKNLLNDTTCIQLDFLAEELRYVQKQIGEIIGKTYSDDMLNEIFSKFCIGK